MSNSEGSNEGHQSRRRSANQGSEEQVRLDMLISAVWRLLAGLRTNNGLNPYAQAPLVNGGHNGIRVYPTRVLPESSSSRSTSTLQPNSPQIVDEVSNNQPRDNNWQPGYAGRILELIRASGFSSPILPQALLYFHRFTNRRLEEFLKVAFLADDNLLTTQMRVWFFLQDLINSQKVAIRTTYRRAVLEGLELRKFCCSDGREAQGELDACCICVDELVNGGCPVKLDCSHYFHFNCIQQWLEVKNQCPVCKRIVIPLV